jgi:hypothetical protein
MSQTIRSWLREAIVGAFGNAIYDILKTWGPGVIASYVAPVIYWLAAKIGYIHWNWRIIAGLILVAVIINVFAVVKLVKGRPVRLTASQRSAIQDSRSAALKGLEIEAVEKNLGAIRRRVEEVQESVNANSRVVNLMSHLDIPATREIADATDYAKIITEIEPELITESNRIERDMNWPEFRKMGNAVGEVNRTVTRYNSTPEPALSERLSRDLEQVRKHIVVIDREFVERFRQIPNSSKAV